MDKEKEIAKLKKSNSVAMSKLGSVGGKVTAMRHGPEHFAKLARLAAKSRKRNSKKR